ncbi:MAG: DUF349 domain-containing protein, partial [Bifidobacteriaceae bacterium]|nr:DUF349 domain-containing protein [Bifidobacteriaceae bacterium]
AQPSDEPTPQPDDPPAAGAPVPAQPSDEPTPQPDDPPAVDAAGAEPTDPAPAESPPAVDAAPAEPSDPAPAEDASAGPPPASPDAIAATPDEPTPEAEPADDAPAAPADGDSPTAPTAPTDGSPAGSQPAAEAPEAGGDAPAPDAPTEAPPVAEAAETAPAGTAASDTAGLAVPRPRPPAPKPGPRTAPRPGPRPGAPVAPVGPPTHAEEDIARASEWGRVDPDGTVFVKEGKAERAVGQFPGVPAAEALALYAKRFLDLEAQVKLFETRVDGLTQKDIDQTLASLKQALNQPAAVGDLDGLRARYRAAKARAAAVRQRLEAERAAAKAEALAQRTALVERAEAIANQDSEQINWKRASGELRQTLDTWREAQRGGPKIDRSTEDDLWRRFSQARANFDRKRRVFFAELDKRQGATKLVKEKIVEDAEKLATSQDWGATGRAYRELMDRWKAAGRLARRDDDALWERFRAAQDRFYRARDAQHAANDAERGANLDAKLVIVEEAEKLLPVTDLRAARAKLRELEERWDKVGHVPRRDEDRVEARMKAVEDAVRGEEERTWRKSNPETIARVASMTSQLEAVIEGLERKLVKVEASGDQTAIAALKEDIAGRKQMLANLRQSAERGWE